MIKRIKNLFGHKHKWIPTYAFIDTETNFVSLNYSCAKCRIAYFSRQHRLVRDGKYIEFPYHVWDIPE